MSLSSLKDNKEKSEVGPTSVVIVGATRGCYGSSSIVFWCFVGRSCCSTHTHRFEIIRIIRVRKKRKIKHTRQVQAQYVCVSSSVVFAVANIIILTWCYCWKFAAPTVVAVQGLSDE